MLTFLIDLEQRSEQEVESLFMALDARKLQIVDEPCAKFVFDKPLEGKLGDADLFAIFENLYTIDHDLAL